MKKLSYLGRLGLHGGKFLWTVFVILCSAAAMLVKKRAWVGVVVGLSATAGKGDGAKFSHTTENKYWNDPLCDSQMLGNCDDPALGDFSG